MKSSAQRVRGLVLDHGYFRLRTRYLCLDLVASYGWCLPEKYGRVHDPPNLIQLQSWEGVTPLKMYRAMMMLSLSLAENSQICLDHQTSSYLVQGQQGCGCCEATERASHTISISAKGLLKMQLKCSPESECNYTNRLMGHY